MSGNAADNDFMHMALQLARRGIGQVSPNPPVGAVLAIDDKIIGRGYHKRFGDDHAEIMAIKSTGGSVTGATLYGTLEPCGTTGKTPACTQAIIEAGISRVVIAILDPNPAVNGSSVELLETAGIDVTVGVEIAQAARLIRGFRKWINTSQPFVTLKIARTSDNYVLQSLGNQPWFTSDQSRQKVHELRAEHDAVLVGSNTVVSDNPKLTVRENIGSNPIRVVLDSNNRLSEDHNLFSDFAAETLRFSYRGAVGKRKWGEHVIVPRSGNGLSLAAVMDVLGKRGVTSVLIEGGPRVQRAFFDEGLADEIAIFTSPHKADAAVTQSDNLANTVAIPVDWQMIEDCATGVDNFQLAAKSRKGA